MRIGFLVSYFDEDLPKLLEFIKEHEFFIIEKSQEETEYVNSENIKVIKTLNFERIIEKERIELLLIDREINFKSKKAVNVKLVDNELETNIFDYEFFAIRTKRVEGMLYLPYFIDFDFFSTFEDKLKKYDRILRITILTNSFDITLVSLLERLLSLRETFKNLNFIVYKAASSQQYPFVNFVSRELKKKERAELFLNSRLIISIENRKKEVLEAMALKRIVITNDGFLSTPKINLNNLNSQISRLIKLEEFEANQIIAQQFDIENVAKILKEDLKIFIEEKITRA